MEKKENNDMSLLKAEIDYLKAKLSMSDSAFLNIVGKSLDGVIIIDRKKMVVYTNYAAIKLFDRNIADLLGEPLKLNFNPAKLVNSQETTTEITIPKADGTQVITEVSVHNTEWNNEPCYVITFRDITERKKSEKELEYLSTHDFLTDLPNRVELAKLIDSSIEYADSHGQHMALFYLDLDNFKIINDTLGHTAGDQLLKSVSVTLQQSIRRGDTVVRVGGDEFVLVINALRKPEYAAKVAHAVLDKISQVYEVKGKAVYTNASLGIAVYPKAGANAAELLKNADTAMYVAKKRGRNQYRFYSEELNQQSERKLAITNGLRDVIRNQELFFRVSTHY